MTAITTTAEATSSNRGGKREGAGRKPTGRNRHSFYVTEQERMELERCRQALREGKKVFTENDIIEHYKKKIKTALNEQNWAIDGVNYSHYTYYKLQAIGEVLGYSYAKIKDDFKIQVDKWKNSKRQEKRKNNIDNKRKM